MNKARMIKTTLCMATALTAMLMVNGHKAEAATMKASAETSVAGISVSFDRYYTLVASDEVTEFEQFIQEQAEANNEGIAVASVEAEAPVSEYENVGISIAPTFVNIRTEASTESEAVGKLYKGSAATILETVGDWVKIKSGAVEGYIKSEYLAIGFSAEELVDQYGTRLATVNTTTLRVREEKNTDCRTVTLIPMGESFEVVSFDDEWVEIVVDNDATGYVSRDLVIMSVEFEEAISVAEENAQKEREEAARKAEVEAARLKAEKEAAEKAEALKQQQQAANKKPSTSQNTSSSSSSSSSSSNAGSSSTPSQSVSGSSLGQKIASFALNYVGNKYVYGGNSLTNGTDCSGFTKLIYANFGYSIPRSSGAQASGAGTKISINSVQPGDLIFYDKSGTVNHVALYIGNGQVVHASNPKSGIKVSNMNYRTPYMARRVIQ